MARGSGRGSEGRRTRVRIWRSGGGPRRARSRSLADTSVGVGRRRTDAEPTETPARSGRVAVGPRVLNETRGRGAQRSAARCGGVTRLPGIAGTTVAGISTYRKERVDTEGRRKERGKIRRERKKRKNEGKEEEKAMTLTYNKKRNGGGQEQKGEERKGEERKRGRDKKQRRREFMKEQ